ncbi:MAG: polyprenyl synthetase family protein [Candidatus Bathyarchaeia archaeon]
MGSGERFEKIAAEIERLGRKAYEIAKETVMKEKFEYEPLQEAISYFMQEWRNFQHPALLAIACEAVGGKPEKTTLVGAALVLLTGAADIHDDIIDKSKTKGSKLTLYGKFGEDLSIIVGNVLFIEGLTLLNTACSELPKEQGETVQKLVKRGLFELGAAEAEETSLKGNWNLKPECYLDIIRRKAAVAETAARVGAVIGCANPEDVEQWAEIGRMLGMLMNIREEFLDIFKAEELQNRKNNECLPLPILYALSNLKAKRKIMHLLKKKELTDDDAMKMVAIVLETPDVQRLKIEMRKLINIAEELLSKYKKCKNIKILKSLTTLALEICKS